MSGTSRSSYLGIHKPNHAGLRAWSSHEGVMSALSKALTSAFLTPRWSEIPEIDKLVILITIMTYGER